MFGARYYGDAYFGPRYWGKGAVSLTTVPDVVGQDEASATTEITGVGLTVTVTTAYSSVVAAGLVISQSPAAGAEVAPGSAVTIVISLGDAPVTDTPSGGGGFYLDYELSIAKRRKRKKELEEAEEEAKALQDAVDAEIAQLLHAQERKDEEREHLERIRALVAKYPQEKLDVERVDNALKMAQLKQTIASYEALEREIERMNEEEDFMVMTLLALID